MWLSRYLFLLLTGIAFSVLPRCSCIITTARGTRRIQSNSYSVLILLTSNLCFANLRVSAMSARLSSALMVLYSRFTADDRHSR